MRKEIILLLLILSLISFPTNNNLSAGLDPENVTVSLNYGNNSNQETIIDDQTNPGQGRYSSSQLDFPYFLTSNEGEREISGLVAYPSTNFLSLSFKENKSSKNVEMTTEFSQGSTLIPWTSGSYNSLSRFESEFKQETFFDYPRSSIGYGLDQKKTVRLKLIYRDILFSNNLRRLASGNYNFIIRNQGEAEDKTKLKIEREW